MPRNGDIYSPPAGTKGAPKTTIQSSKYNTLVDDLTIDANAPRPLTAGGTGASNALQARKNLGSEIGVNVQAYDAFLQAVSALTTTANQMIYTTGSDTVALTTVTTYGRSLIDDADAAAARTTLELGSLATKNDINNANWNGADLAIENGGTGASTVAAARTNLDVYSKAEANAAISTGNVARVAKTGDTMSGSLIVPELWVQSGAPTLRMQDTDWGPMYLHHNAGLMGFLNAGGGWSFYVNQGNGAIWTAQFGDLNNRIYDVANERGAAWRNDAIANIPSTVGGLGVDASGSTVFARYVPGGVVSTGAYVAGSNLRTCGSSTGGTSADYGVALSGTWICCGALGGSLQFTLFRRVN